MLVYLLICCLFVCFIEDTSQYGRDKNYLEKNIHICMRTCPFHNVNPEHGLKLVISLWLVVIFINPFYCYFRLKYICCYLIVCPSNSMFSWISIISESQQRLVFMQSIDAFTYLVRDDSTTLLDISRKNHFFVSDLLALNPDIIDGSGLVTLKKGTEVKLPKTLRARGTAEGPAFRIQEEETKLQRLDEALKKWCSAVKRLPLPQRKVQSMTESIVAHAYSEADRQLPKVSEKITRMGAVHNADEMIIKKQVHHLVDVSSVQHKMKELEKQFSPECVHLSSYREDNQDLLSRELASRHSESVATPGSRVHLPENSVLLNHPCDHEHTHRWEFVVCRPNSLETQETWAVLSCQRLTTLMSVISCPFKDRLPEDINSSFFFVNGTFFSHGSEDLSAVIRLFDPTSVNGLGENKSFSDCPVHQAEKVTVGELELRIGELYVYRHLGNCDHYFYLRGVSELSIPGVSKEVADYPAQLMKKKDKVIRCTQCKKLPSTVAVYEDNKTKDPPRYVCDICYELLYGGTNQGDLPRIYRKVLNEGEYFTY